LPGIAPLAYARGSDAGAPVVTPPLLEVRGVSRRYATKRTDTLALENVSLSLHEGEFVCLLGPSGCGKSTLRNIVAGFESPDAGEVVVPHPRIPDSHAVVDLAATSARS